VKKFNFFTFLRVKNRKNPKIRVLDFSKSKNLSKFEEKMCDFCVFRENRQNQAKISSALLADAKSDKKCELNFTYFLT
jgi:hypothetical protein